MPGGAERPDYDQTLKRLLSRAHDGLVALLLPGARWLGELSPELTPERRQADLVWQVLLGTERLYLHIELQTTADSLIGERTAEYALRLWRRDHLPVYSVVIYLREVRLIPVASFSFARRGGQEALRFAYTVIRLWQEPAERVLGMAEAGLWPLAALMAGPAEETLETVVERLARAPLPPGERGELTGLLAVLAGLRLPRPVIEQVMRRHRVIRDLLSQSSVAEILREEAEAKGVAEGRAIGVAEGRAEGQRSLVQMLLENRFGALEAAELTALGAAEEPVLRDLAAHIATDSREQLRGRLGLP
jgi:predicted transposase YdaD